MIVTLLVDNKGSWFIPHAQRLREELLARGHDAVLVHDAEAVRKGDLAFFLSCERLIKKPIRDRNAHSLVVHSSALPEGKGWSPMTWAILEGENELTNTLFEAVDAVDAGDIYMQNTIQFDGHELLDELHDKQGKGICQLILSFIDAYPDVTAYPQEGEETFFDRRNPLDSELDTSKTIAEQFDLLRVVDNKKYPAFFRHRGHTYRLTIEKDMNHDDHG